MHNCKATNDGRVEDLINEYLAKVKKATDLLEHAFGTKSILRLWRTNKIPQRGSIIEGVTYELHGIGCRVYLSEACIDFDYGPDERVDGFDLWRLYVYACEVPHRYKKHTDEKTLKREFNEFLEKGNAKRVRGSGSNLYFMQSC